MSLELMDVEEQDKMYTLEGQRFYDGPSRSGFYTVTDVIEDDYYDGATNFCITLKSDQYVPSGILWFGSYEEFMQRFEPYQTEDV